MTEVRRVAVIGAGLVGMSTAWFLLERGASVEVFDQNEPGTGASSGNAGWITPDLVEPLGTPATARHAMKAVLRPGSPVSLRTAHAADLRFFSRLLRNSTQARYARAMTALRPLAESALPAYERLNQGNRVNRAPIIALFRSTRARDPFLEAHSQYAIEVDELDEAGAHEQVDGLSSWVVAGALIHKQAFIDPRRFTTEVAGEFLSRGGRVSTGSIVVELVRQRTGVAVRLEGAAVQPRPFDAVVVAVGASADSLLCKHGVDLHVAAGRGYSFSALHGHAPSIPIYVPEHRLARTPLHDALRIVGVMEFGVRGAPARRGQIEAMAGAAQRVFSRSIGPVSDTWVGSRPCTADGLPLLGETATPGVFAAVGHAMWGITLGPASGEMLARRVLGEGVPELRPFDPLRRKWTTLDDITHTY